MLIILSCHTLGEKKVTASYSLGFVWIQFQKSIKKEGRERRLYAFINYDYFEVKMERKTLQKPMAYCDEVYYQVRSTSLGFCLMAATKKGICAVSLGEKSSALIVELTGQFLKATLVDIDELSNDKETAIWCVWFDKVIVQIESSNNEISDLPLDIQGTDFQQLVWRALSAIPAGEIRTYSDIAAILDKPNAVRAVATACAANKIAVLIPCHRVVRKGGSLAGYRWGLARKKVLLDREKYLKIH